MRANSSKQNTNPPSLFFIHELSGSPARSAPKDLSSNGKYIVPTRAHSYIDGLVPHHLLNPVTEPAHLQHGHHLLGADLERPLGQEPPETFAARRRRETACVSPILLHLTDLLNREHMIHVHSCCFRGIVEVDQRGQLVEESAACCCGRLDAHSYYGGSIAGRVRVHQMHLGAGADAIHQVFGWEMDMPAGKKDGLIVEAQRWKGREVGAFLMVDGVSRAEAPVVESTGRGSVCCIAREGRGVGGGKALRGEDVDGRLTGARMAELVF